MDAQNMQMMAGMLSSLIFMAGTLPMLIKAFRTKDLQSYSLGYLLMSNIGNLVHWLYVSSLPFGPIWLLHGFFTLTTAMMLIWYLRYEFRWCASQIQAYMSAFFAFVRRGSSKSASESR